MSAANVAPHRSVVAEQCVLGGLLLDNSAWNRIVGITTESFHSRDHRLLFAAIADLLKRGMPADVITVSDRLEKNSELETVGGLAYLGTLANNTPSATNIVAYVNIVREHALLREKLKEVEQVRAALLVGNDEAADRIFAVSRLWKPTEQRVRELPDEAMGGRDWPEPLELVVKVVSEPYPLDALPDAIQAAVIEVQGFTKAPISMVASSALAALSLAIQAHVDVKRADRLTGPVGLFLLTIADSGERKSTCEGFFTAAIQEYQQQQAESAKPDITKHRAHIAAWEAKRAGLIEAIKQAARKGCTMADDESNLRDLEEKKPEPKRVPKLLRGDDTPENLAWVLSREWPSSGVLSSEAGIVLGAHGMGKDSIMRNLGLLNILWDGGVLSIGRRTSESFTVRGARLTMALQVQEATLRSFFDRSGGLARGTGFLARFLVAWPESTQGFRPFTDPPASWPRLAAFNRRITAILNQPAPIDEAGALTPPLLSLSPEAKAAWVAFHDAIEGELSTGGELYDVRDVASKSADNAARLAALFQIYEGAGGTIGTDAFEGASRIAAWHLNEARRFFGELVLPMELANAARLDTWLVQYCRRKRTHLVPIAKLQQGGPCGLRSKATIETAMHELEEAGRARLVRDGKRKMIAVNPALLIEGGAS